MPLNNVSFLLRVYNYGSIGKYLMGNEKNFKQNSMLFYGFMILLKHSSEHMNDR